MFGLGCYPGVGWNVDLRSGYHEKNAPKVPHSRIPQRHPILQYLKLEKKIDQKGDWRKEVGCYANAHRRDTNPTRHHQNSPGIPLLPVPTLERISWNDAGDPLRKVV